MLPLGIAQQASSSPSSFKGDWVGAPVTYHPALLPFLSVQADCLEASPVQGGQCGTWQRPLRTRAELTGSGCSRAIITDTLCLLWFCRARPSCPSLGFLAQVWA